MNRVHIHWTAGTHRVSTLDKKHYHFIVNGDGEVEPGDLLPEANLSTKDGRYAAHTRGANTGAIGVAFAAMHGAKESPFDAGDHAITREQVYAMAGLVADLCETYGIKVTPRTVLTHAEIQPTLGIKQRGKWDVTWLPGMHKPDSAIVVGNKLREMIQSRMEPKRKTLFGKPLKCAALSRSKTND